MLHRVLEPEVMDSPGEARDYDAMDHAAVNRLFVADFLAIWDQRGPILDLGTGTAQIPIELVRAAPDACVVAVDLAFHMLALARLNLQRAGCSQRVRLVPADAKRLPFADGAFPAIISNSIVHHIPRPESVLAELVRVLAPGGTLLVRDLLRPADEAELRQLVRAHAGTATESQQQMFADSLHAALSLDEIRVMVRDLGMDPGTLRQTSDRHWTWAVPGQRKQ